MTDERIAEYLKALENSGEKFHTKLLATIVLYVSLHG